MKYPDDQKIMEMISSVSDREEGYKFLISKYKEKLYWHIRRMVHNHEDADDVLQNTFIKVVRNIDRFKENSSLYTWMYRIASNESLNLIQAQKRHASDSFESNHSPAASDALLSEEETLKQLSIAIESLPVKQKLVFNLRYYEELSYKDIAEITETSEGALKASYHHAVKKIEEHLRSIV